MASTSKSTNHYSLKKSRECLTFQYDFDENILLSIIFSICFVIGLILVFAGYRFFRASLFIQSSSVVCLMTYLLMSRFSMESSDVVQAAVTTSTGLVLGITAMFVTSLGLMLSSFIQSIFVTTCILYTIHVFTIVTSPYVAPSIAVVMFIGFLVVVLKWQRAVSIMYICSFGTILIMLSMDYFFDLSMLRMTAYENALLQERKTHPCWFSWIVLALWPLLLFCGCIVQFLKTGKEIDHTSDKYWYCRSNSTPKVRLLSNKSDVNAKSLIDETSSPTSSEKLLRNTSANDVTTREGNVFIKEDVTSV